MTKLPRGPELVALALVAAMGGLAGSAARGLTSAAFLAAGGAEWGSRLAVNVCGAFLAGVVVARLRVPESADPLHHRSLRRRRREHLLITGFLGGFTTISGFAWDTVVLSQGAGAAPEPGQAASLHLAMVLVGNGVVGIAAAAAGLALGRRTLRA
ncbi:MAG: CrcB family protein [Phycisphaerales bacterium]